MDALFPDTPAEAEQNESAAEPADTQPAEASTEVEQS
jgi:hypothetical protein